MVRNDELKETSRTSQLIAARIRDAIEQKGYSQTELGHIIGRAQSYVSLRILGRKPWTVDDLDAIAPRIGYDNALDMICSMRDAIIADRANDHKRYGLAANSYTERDAESEASED